MSMPQERPADDRACAHPVGEFSILSNLEEPGPHGFKRWSGSEIKGLRAVNCYHGYGSYVLGSRGLGVRAI